jgi:hypothetical protein
MAKKEKTVEVAPETETGEPVEVAPETPTLAPTPSAHRTAPAVRMLATTSLKFTWSEGEGSYVVSALDAGGKLFLSGKKIKKGEPVGANTSQAVGELAETWQGQANTVAAIFSQG